MAALVQPVTLRQARDRDAPAVLALLALDHHLELAFDPREFVVAEREGKVVACGRLKPLGGGEAEIASVVVAPELRGQGVGAKLVREILSRAPPTVYALALAPEFFRALGFRPIDAVPAVLAEKATSVCASSGFVPMRKDRA